MERLLPPETMEEMDLFDLLELAGVVDVCAGASSLSAAGGTLFGVSRERKRSSNGADRLRKYLAKFGLSWEKL